MKIRKFFIILIISLLVLSGCDNKREIKEYEKLVQNFNKIVLNGYPLQDINNDIYDSVNTRNSFSRDRMKHTLSFYNSFKKEKKKLDAFVKNKFYNRKLKSLHKELKSEYIKISGNITILSDKQYTRDTIESEEYSDISNSLMNIDKIMKQHGLKSNIDFSNDYISKKEKLEKLYEKNYEFNSEKEVKEFMNDFFKGLYILDINNNVLEKEEIDGYQSLLLELLANHYAQYNDIYSENEDNNFMKNISFSFETHDVQKCANEASRSFENGNKLDAIGYKEQLKYKFRSLRKIAPSVKTKYYISDDTIKISK